MKEKKIGKLVIGVLAVLVLLGFLFMGYFCADQTCALKPGSPTPGYLHFDVQAYLKGELPAKVFEEKDLERDFQVDLEDGDVIVFHHMQKTGGTTFGRHLVNDLQLKHPCRKVDGRKRYDCQNSDHHVWLFSRYSTGWRCGLHADWTELQECVDREMDAFEGKHRTRRYHYITMLRDPVKRYLSEWMHVRRGATWKTAQLRCNGRQATLQEVPFCYNSSDWYGVTIEEFLACPHNLGNNRQTRMLANLSAVGCYNRSLLPPDVRDKMLLESAKTNLRNMAYFGILEYQPEMQYLFEKTFHLKFGVQFSLFNKTHITKLKMSNKTVEEIVKVNSLDVKLYQYAKELFLQRVNHVRRKAAKAQETISQYSNLEKSNIDYIVDSSKQVVPKKEVLSRSEENNDGSSRSGSINDKTERSQSTLDVHVSETVPKKVKGDHDLEPGRFDGSRSEGIDEPRKSNIEPQIDKSEGDQADSRLKSLHQEKSLLTSKPGIDGLHRESRSRQVTGENYDDSELDIDEEDNDDEDEVK
ncbi:heparan-sulfate 6-O-sulfotransferase 2 [Lingula anatina]|uniref:Heparan-sulfate 6-O-sulfotransferase n=1 Tax=Lingula anatina TaxID=7574 RepID=A0A1S3K0P5_LINAN|nr:heparan-sulfate 6-O-sulfotransferase 2 [Lingula anatina]|eukprot:XP_013415939.1 heparan-sulfate 6-O-sulfotransferase 2 [Lingula anatina]